MKTPRASTGILSSENDDFEFLKPAKDIKKAGASRASSFQGSWKYLSLQTS